VAKDQIEAQQPRTVSGALNYTAGIFAEPRGAVNGLYEFPNIRGFNLPSFLYQDGMQSLGASAGYQIEPYGLERIEAIKGPASVLYGQGSPSGIVNAITKRPTDVPFNEIQIQGGSFDRKQVNIDSSGKLDKDGQFLYRFTGMAREAGTQVDFTKDNRVYVAPAITWRPTTNTTWTVLFNYQKADSGFFNFLPNSGTWLPNPNGRIPTNFYTGDPNFNKSTIENKAVTSLFEHRFNEIVTFRSSYRHAELAVDQDLLNTGGFIGNNTLTRSTFSNYDRFTADTTDNQFQFKVKSGALENTVLTGVDYAHSYEDHKNRQDTVAPPSINVFNPVYGVAISPPRFLTLDATQTVDQTGIYAQHQGKLGGWNTQVGVRWDDATTSTKNSPTFLAPVPSTSNQHDTAVTKRAGLLYLFDNGVAPYVSYSESFAPQSGLDRLNNPFKPTTGRQYEAGIKYQPVGHKALFTLAAFDLVRQNILTPDPLAPTTRSVQTGEVTSRGIEAEAKVSLSNSLDVVGAYTYLDIKVTKSNDPTELGRMPIGVPRNMASLWADYTFRTGPLSGFGVALGGRYIGNTYIDKTNVLGPLPDYTVMDAAIHYELGEFDPRLKGMKLAVNATNLLDKTYVSSCLLSNFCYYGLRRNVIGTLSYRW
jgi:iron complex outermembrane receptor protein